MITKLTGRLVALDEDRATLAVDGFEYEVLVSDYAGRQLRPSLGQSVALHTIQYIEGNPTAGRLTPRLIGFVTVSEREFFEEFCSVDGVGVKKALRAMVRPVRDIAVLIEEQDVKGLSTLPGIGPATGERIVAKLRRKMPRFALMVAPEAPGRESLGGDLIRDVFDTLLKLGHAESDARRLMDVVLEGGGKKPSTVEDFLQEIYKKTR